MIIIQKVIKRIDLRANRHLGYLFGDNAEHKGYGGQAYEMRDEPNAIGIITKLRPTTTDDAFLSDDHLPIIELHLDHVVQRIKLYQAIVIPADGIGTDRAKLKEKAPKVLNLINDFIVKINDIEFTDLLSTPTATNRREHEFYTIQLAGLKQLLEK